MRQLDAGVAVVADTIAGEFRVDDLQVDDAIDDHLDVVFGHTGLAGDVDGFFFQCVLVGHFVNERNQDVEAGFEGFGVFAEALDDEGGSLWDDAYGFDEGDDDQRDDGQHDDCGDIKFHWWFSGV